MVNPAPGRLLLLGARAVDALLDPPSCIAAVEAAFRQSDAGPAIAMGVLGIRVAGGGFHLKAAALPGGRPYFAAKINGNFPGNPDQRGLPTIQGLVVLCDAASGTPLALFDSVRITALRTAAATAVAARHLARTDAAGVLLIGCGVQAMAQLQALSAVRPIQRVWCADLRRERAETVARLARDAGLAARVAADWKAHSRECDLLVTCTTATRPFLGAADVAPGAFVAGVGADNEQKCELEPGLLASARVVVDVVDQCAVMGDLRAAIAVGAMTRDDVHAELGAVVAGTRPGRRSDAEVFVFDSTGTALQDVAAAAMAYERALTLGRGEWLDLQQAGLRSTPGPPPG
jgi:alanine dehydrogenase